MKIIEIITSFERDFLFLTLIIALLLILLFVIFLLIKNRKQKIIIVKQAAELSTALEEAKYLSEYEIMKYTLTNKALHIALWDMEVVDTDPVNKNNKIIWSEELRRMLGFSGKEDFPDVLYSWSDRLHPEDKERAVKAFEAHITDRSGNTPFDIEYRLLLKDGTYREFRALGDTLRDSEGTPLRVAGALEDITEKKLLQKDLEEALQRAYDASRAKGDFLANMSHEIRTPINAIMGMAELALRENTTYGKNKHILTVKQAGSNLLSIINDILDFSKVEKGKIEIIPEYYSISSLINDVISIIRMRVLDSHLRFAVFIDSNIPANLIGDETRIRQVLLNVLTNAIKYTEKGFVSFTVRGEFIDDENINLIMGVQDSGKGIKKEEIGSLFQEFTKLDIDKNKKIEGVGLGLSITNGIVKAMDGNINVHSEYGRGSIFSIKIPQKYESREVLASVENPDKKNVLIYERREVYINTIVYTLNSLNIENTFVIDEDKFLEKISSNSYDFIFIAFLLFKNNKEKIMKNRGGAKIVVLTEFGETIPEKNLIVLAMPVYCISIANVLNGIVENFSYDKISEIIVRFIAPDAKVLIVDDINTNLKVTQGLLLPYNMQIDLCKNGIEAIEAVKSKHYDLIFLDHKMPGIDGLEVAKRIRQLSDPYNKKVPIIAITANVVSGVKPLLLENGFDDFLPKPIDTVELNSILEKWIPKEKQKDFAEINEMDKTNVFTIKGLDIQKGVFRSGGIENYKDVLNSFYLDFVEKISEIENYRSSGNWLMYISCVHALKGAAAMIGADDLSQTAKSLELAGKQEDYSFINTNNSILLDELQMLLNDIFNIMNKEKHEGYFSTETLKSSLLELSAAITDLNSSTMHQIIEELKKTVKVKNINIAINKISDYILMGEYDEAVSLANSLRAKL